MERSLILVTAFKRASIALLASLLLLVPLSSCDSKKAATDYSKPEYWLSLPDTAEKAVDVFYLYPTGYVKASADAPNVCEIDNSVMRQNAQRALEGQAFAFETVCNIYAPYYRQVDAAYALSLPPDELTRLLGGDEKSDVLAAFDYFIKHENNGRPFVLAGHSQGSQMLLFLLSDYMKEHPEVYKRMVAAYVVGYSVTEDFLQKNPHLKFAEAADDTGVIISYNTEAPTVEGNNPVLLPGALVINPISWTRDETPAKAKESLGSIMLNRDATVQRDEKGQIIKLPDFADATIDLKRGVVICSTADAATLAPGSAVFGKGVFHPFDYAFYYYDLQKNAQERVDKFLSNR